MQIKPEWIEVALIAAGSQPVGAGDGNTRIASVMTPQTLRAALEAVAPLIAEAEREACILIACKTKPASANFDEVWGEYEYGVSDTQDALAAAIRARGEDNG